MTRLTVQQEHPNAIKMYTEPPLKGVTEKKKKKEKKTRPHGPSHSFPIHPGGSRGGESSRVGMAEEEALLFAVVVD